MDPNKCFDRIISTKNTDEFVEAFQDLSDWLEKGGFPPKVNDLGLTTCVRSDGTSTWYGKKKRRHISDVSLTRIQCHAIMTKDPNKDGPPFVFVIYNDQIGTEKIKEFELPYDEAS